MPDIYAAPYGTYQTLGGTLTATQKTNLAAQITALKNLIPDITTGVAVTYAPDFAECDPNFAFKLRAELTALSTQLLLTSTT